MVDSSAFIHESLNPGLKHLKLEETFGRITFREFYRVLCDSATLLGSDMLLFPWLLWVMLPAQFTKC